jgi:hypothetical protein
MAVLREILPRKSNLQEVQVPAASRQRCVHSSEKVHPKHLLLLYLSFTRMKRVTGAPSVRQDNVKPYGYVTYLCSHGFRAIMTEFPDSVNTLTSSSSKPTELKSLLKSSRDRSRAL